MEREDIKKVIESLLYMTDHALTPKEIIEVLDTKTWSVEEIKSIIADIGHGLDAAQSSLHVLEVAGGFQMATRSEFASWIRRLYRERLTVRLSSSALETLSIIAYKQPIARSEIEQIRGVEVTGVMETLLERRLIKVVGRKETIGRPLLYGTTIEFLRHFGLKHLTELPDLNSMAVTKPSETPAATPQEEALVFAGDVPAETVESAEAPVPESEPAPELPPLSEPS
jgi:segregation and condensation protein B